MPLGLVLWVIIGWATHALDASFLSQPSRGSPAVRRHLAHTARCEFLFWECESLSREARGYSSSFHRIHQQQSVLYASHVRQVKSLSSQLLKAEARAAKAEARASEDRVRIDSWSAMAAALETSGEGAQAAVAGLGRRLTALRVKELTLSRTAAAQAAELDGLRRGRRALADEARAAAVEAAARAA
eukprot:scaffold12798_cov67-Isochrysis_galbana.AAC.1